MQQKNYRNTPKNIVVSIDIGTSKISGLAGIKDEYGMVNILAESSVKSVGVLRGIISNADKVSRTIKGIIENLESRIDQSITSVYVGISNQYINNVLKLSLIHI